MARAANRYWTYGRLHLLCNWDIPVNIEFTRCICISDGGFPACRPPNDPNLTEDGTDDSTTRLHPLLRLLLLLRRLQSLRLILPEGNDHIPYQHHVRRDGRQSPRIRRVPCSQSARPQAHPLACNVNL